MTVEWSFRRTGRAAACRWCAARAGRSAPGRPAPADRCARRSPAARRAAARANRSASASREHPRPLEAVEQVEADDRARVAQQRAGAHLVGLAAWRSRRRRSARTARAPCRRRRTPRRRTCRTRRPRLAPSLASISRSVRPSARGVDRDVGAELERQRALAPRWRRSRSRGRRPARGRAARRSSRRRRRRECTTTLSPAATRPAVRYRCHAVVPWMISASAVPSSTPSGIGKTRSLGAIAYSA